MKREYLRIRWLCRKLLDKNSRKKLRKIKDFKERTEGLKYLIGSKLRLLLLDLESKLGGVDRKESLILESKIRLLSSKIKIFESTYSKRDYLVLQKLEKEIKREIENVWTV